ncbi:DUF6298 domain-containing protein [Nonomuraea sp. NPDC049480]|uniref:DUF6298 domain-containing protein n=1 Tax=Nonomuraea sp. NPDC049480 TaxID=3364353 RepID=UPI003789EE5B
MAEEQRRDQHSGRLPGPLEISGDNPRYFTVRTDNPARRRAVYLTGSHIWNNFHDGMGPGATPPAEPERLDYDAYLDFLAAHGHNFIRLWRWEQFRSQAAGGAFHLNMTPQPWPRTGPGTAKDGGPKFDLSRLDPAYFQRLRERVTRAGERGMYVAVMLFEGWALHLSPAPDNVEGHPCHPANNVNGVGITSIVDYHVLPLDPDVRALQEAYIRQVVDTVHDLPNVLYEVANESSGGGAVDQEMAALLGVPLDTEWGDSTGWQYWVIDFVILMDFGLIDGIQPAPDTPSFAAFEPARHAMGDTRRYAERIDLIGMPPHGELSSTGYALAHPGREYLILQPSEAGEAFTAAPAAGTYTAHWYGVNDRASRSGGELTVPGDEPVNFAPPPTINGPAVLHLKRASG